MCSPAAGAGACVMSVRRASRGARRRRASRSRASACALPHSCRRPCARAPSRSSGRRRRRPRALELAGAREPPPRRHPTPVVVVVARQRASTRTRAPHSRRSPRSARRPSRRRRRDSNPRRPVPAAQPLRVEAARSGALRRRRRGLRRRRRGLSGGQRRRVGRARAAANFASENAKRWSTSSMPGARFNRSTASSIAPASGTRPGSLQGLFQRLCGHRRRGLHAADQVVSERRDLVLYEELISASLMPLPPPPPIGMYCGSHLPRLPPRPSMRVSLALLLPTWRRGEVVASLCVFGQRLQRALCSGTIARRSAA